MTRPRKPRERDAETGKFIPSRTWDEIIESFGSVKPSDAEPSYGSRRFPISVLMGYDAANGRIIVPATGIGKYLTGNGRVLVEVDPADRKKLGGAVFVRPSAANATILEPCDPNEERWTPAKDADGGSREGSEWVREEPALWQGDPLSIPS